MININQTSEQTKILIPRSNINGDIEKDNYVTEDELQDILKEYNTVPYIVVDGFPHSGFEITKGDWGAVHNAIQNNKPYLIYARSATNGKIYSLVDDIAPLPNGDVSIATTLIVADRNVTYRIWSIDINGNVELDLEEKYTIQPKLVSGENIKTINGNSILGEGDITIEGGGADVDLSDYVTKDELNKKGYITGIPSEYVTETELNAKGYATTASVNNKQDKLTSGSNIKTINNTSVLGSGNISVQPTLVSGTNIKTINGNSLLGSGNITIKTDVDLSGYVTTDALNSKGYLTSVPSEYITETELSGMGYATQSYVNTQVGDIETILDNIIGNK